jgi:hypothetical protein
MNEDKYYGEKNLKNFIDKVNLGQAILSDDETNKQEDLLYFYDASGFTVDKEKAFEIITKLLKFYKHEDADKFIQENNKEQAIYHLGVNQDDIYTNHLGNKVYYFKPFRKNLKRNWSFTCAWCQQKVSSKDSEGYYMIHSPNYSLQRLNYERTCSEDCAKLLWKEGYNELLKKWSIEQ